MSEIRGRLQFRDSFQGGGGASQSSSQLSQKICFGAINLSTCRSEMVATLDNKKEEIKVDMKEMA